MRNNYVWLQEFAIKKSVGAFIAEQNGNYVNPYTTHELTYVNYDDISFTTDVIKVKCEIVDRKYRLWCGEHSTRWYNMPDGTTFLYYDEFINDEYHDYNIDNIICTPVMLEDGFMYYFKSSTSEWVLCDFGRHEIKDTKYHTLEWCKYDFVNPRLRTMSIGYQLLEYLYSIDCHNTYEFEDYTKSLSWFDHNTCQYFIKCLRHYIENIEPLLKTSSDAYDIVDTIINSKVDDVEFNKFVQFTNVNELVLKLFMSFMRTSDFEYKGV